MKDIIIDKNIRGLIFDCDGTLVDSMPLHMEAWREAFAHFEAKFDRQFIYSMRGMKETQIVDRYNRESGTNLDGEALVRLKHDNFLKQLNHVQPVEPIIEVARSYHGKMPLAVVSGGVNRVVSAELKAVGILELFDVILTADDPYKPKPEPDVFLAAAQKMNVDPKLCLVFEDGDAGLEGASRAGMRSIDVRDYV